MAGEDQCSSPQPGEWVKGKVVGCGTFGAVNLAMSKVTGALFVVKSAQSGSGLVSLENEAEILETLNSPHIVRCVGKEFSSETNGNHRLSVFLEYMAGGSLSDVAEKFGGFLDEQVIRLYTRKILQGLQYLHENGIVHCDLKCKNVLLDSSGNIKLADFGCAKRLDARTSRVSIHSWQPICGTPLWMAPEVLRNEGLDFASDVWSLGCTVVEMATGRLPWAENISNPMAAVLRIACGDDMPQFPEKFSEEGLDFLAKCFARDPKRRWTATQLLCHPFVSGENSRKENAFACSPASVLDVRILEVGYESDESESATDQGLLSSKIPFSVRHCSNRKGMALEQQEEEESNLFSAESWITVRSG
ncbi:mitogen-activated protein kinase kinase kinase 20-like [Malania oleifera]|uniref:mitogen-activated protein kinase kinase kinase 20-like n=1 Tax=Malania oleifera TaxID=397392 RepID=UPI0025AE9EF8|nr:mitogen-activated protein kinase kinase kinase 20-like [Malania oleifera]